jgi:hypothetical protein
MSKDGRIYRFDNAVNNRLSWEYDMSEKIPDLKHLQQAVTDMLSQQETPLPPPTFVEIRATLGLLRTEGITDIVRGHPALTGRTSNCMLLQDVSYKGVQELPDGSDLDTVFYGQVVALGCAAGVEFAYVRNYTHPTDGRGLPCTMQPLVWETKQKKGGQKKARVNTLGAIYTAITTDTLLQKVCIVRDYSREEGNFLVNDLAC